MTLATRRARFSVSSRKSAALPREIWILIVANIFIAMGYGVVSPILPAYARSFGVGIQAATFVITIFSLARLCFAPVSGMLVQRLGERRIYIAGLLVVAASTVASAFVQTYWQLLVFRAFNGIGSTMFFVSALGLMIHISPPDARGRIAGMFTTSFLLGAVGGPKWDTTDPSKLTTSYILKTLKSGSDHANFLAEPYTCDGKAIPAYQAVCNAKYYLYQVKNGAAARVGSTTYDQGTNLIH